MDAKELEEMFGITAIEIKERAKAYESGEWPPGKTTIIGRPPLYDDELESVTFRLPKSRIRAIEELITQKGETRSEFLRKAVDKALAST